MSIHSGKRARVPATGFSLQSAGAKSFPRGLIPFPVWLRVID
jgi:hypothetical protein